MEYIKNPASIESRSFEIIGVENEDLENAIRAVYKAFEN